MSKVVLQHCKFKCDVWLASVFVSEQKTTDKKASSYVPLSFRNIGPSPDGCALT
jgi:hypothetical protein